MQIQRKVTKEANTKTIIQAMYISNVIKIHTNIQRQVKGGPHEIICHHQWLTLGACVIMWWASFIIAIVIVIIIVIIIIIAIIMMITNAKTGRPCRPCDAKFLATVLDKIRLYHAEAETVLEARVATLVIISSSSFFNMRQTISATAGGLFWLRGFSLGGAWLMMGELLMMIVLIKKCANSSRLANLWNPKGKTLTSTSSSS